MPDNQCTHLRARVQRSDIAVVMTLLALGVGVGLVALKQSAFFCEFGDDAVYLSSAKSLADGHGYRLPALPTQPYQTKYPIAWPLLLSVAWRAVGTLDGMVHVVPILNSALWTLANVVAYTVMRRGWRVPWWLAGPAAATALLHTNAILVTATAMSEPLFSLLANATIWMALPAGAAPASQKPVAQAGRTVGTALLVAATLLTRTIGVAIAAGVITGLLVQRRWRSALVTAAFATATIAGWNAWCTSASAANRHMPGRQYFDYDLDYRAWLPRDAQQAVRIAYLNTADLLDSQVEWLTPLSKGLINGEINRGNGWLVLLFGAALFIPAAIGFFNTRRRGAVAIHVSAALTIAVTLIWPWHVDRFLMPLAPFLAGFLLVGASSIVSAVARRLDPRPTVEVEPAKLSAGAATRGWSSSPGSAFSARAAWVFAGLVTYPSFLAMATPGDAPGSAEQRRERDAVVQLIEAYTPADAVISMTPEGHYYYLRTGRTVIPAVPTVDIAVRYADDRRFVDANRVVTPGMVEANRQALRGTYAAYLAAAGATHVLTRAADAQIHDQLRSLRAARPGRLVTVAARDGFELIKLMGNSAP